MAPWKAGKVEKAKPQKKEKIFHPQSRKAAQMNRANVRKDKMAGAASKRVQKQSARSKYDHWSEDGHISDDLWCS